MSPGLDLIVTRHPSTAAWLAQRLAPQRRRIVHLQHLEAGLLQRSHWQGRSVDWAAVRFFGVFPPWLAAEVCSQGAECWVPDLRVAQQCRGGELGAGQIQQLNPALTRYRVIALDRMETRQVSHHNEP